MATSSSVSSYACSIPGCVDDSNKTNESSTVNTLNSKKNRLGFDNLANVSPNNIISSSVGVASIGLSTPRFSIIGRPVELAFGSSEVTSLSTSSSSSTHPYSMKMAALNSPYRREFLLTAKAQLASLRRFIDEEIISGSETIEIFIVTNFFTSADNNYLRPKKSFLGGKLSEDGITEDMRSQVKRSKSNEWSITSRSELEAFFTRISAISEQRGGLTTDYMYVAIVDVLLQKQELMVYPTNSEFVITNEQQLTECIRSLQTLVRANERRLELSIMMLQTSELNERPLISILSNKHCLTTKMKNMIINDKATKHYFIQNIEDQREFELAITNTYQQDRLKNVFVIVTNLYQQRSEMLSQTENSSEYLLWKPVQLPLLGNFLTDATQINSLGKYSLGENAMQLFVYRQYFTPANEEANKLARKPHQVGNDRLRSQDITPRIREQVRESSSVKSEFIRNPAQLQKFLKTVNASTSFMKSEKVGAKDDGASDRILYIRYVTYMGPKMQFMALRGMQDFLITSQEQFVKFLDIIKDKNDEENGFSEERELQVLVSVCKSDLVEVGERLTIDSEQNLFQLNALDKEKVQQLRRSVLDSQRTKHYVIKNSADFQNLLRNIRDSVTECRDFSSHYMYAGISCQISGALSKKIDLRQTISSRIIKEIGAFVERYHEDREDIKEYIKNNIMCIKTTTDEEIGVLAQYILKRYNIEPVKQTSNCLLRYFSNSNSDFDFRSYLQELAAKWSSTKTERTEISKKETKIITSKILKYLEYLKIKDVLVNAQGREDNSREDENIFFHRKFAGRQDKTSKNIQDNSTLNPYVEDYKISIHPFFKIAIPDWLSETYNKMEATVEDNLIPLRESQQIIRNFGWQSFNYMELAKRTYIFYKTINSQIITQWNGLYRPIKLSIKANAIAAIVLEYLSELEIAEINKGPWFSEELEPIQQRRMAVYFKINEVGNYNIADLYGKGNNNLVGLNGKNSVTNNSLSSSSTNKDIPLVTIGDKISSSSVHPTVSGNNPSTTTGRAVSSSSPQPMGMLSSSSVHPTISGLSSTTAGRAISSSSPQPMGMLSSSSVHPTISSNNPLMIMGGTITSSSEHPISVTPVLNADKAGIELEKNEVILKIGDDDTQLPRMTVAMIAENI